MASADADETRAGVLATVLAEWREGKSRSAQVVQHVEEPSRKNLEKAPPLSLCRIPALRT